MFGISLVVLCSVVGAFSIQLQDVFEWQQLPFAWTDAEQEKNWTDNKHYIQENNLPLGIDKWNDKLFITVPRWKAGVASTLNYVSLDSKTKSPTLIPYPSWEANTLPATPEEGKTNPKLTSVFRVRVDVCDRLWVMDTGLADILGSPHAFSKPQLMIYDLKTDQLVKRYEFKPTDLKEDSFFANVIVDVTNETCDDAYAYIPDLGGYGVVVYSLKEDDSWRIKHNFFHFDPLSGEYEVGGVKFQWTDGVFGLALSKIKDDGFRTMYFHALSSTKEFSVSTEILRNKTLALDPHTYHDYHLEGERGEKTQASASYLDENTGVLFLTQVNKNGVACWNTKKELTPDTVGLIASDNEKLVFPNDLTVDKEGQLWVLSDRMPKFIYQELDYKEKNYRILKTQIADAIENTVCGNL